MGYYKSPFGRNNFNGFLNEISKRECQMREFSKLDRKSKTTNKSDKLFVKVTTCWLCDNEYKKVVDEVMKLNIIVNYLVTIQEQLTNSLSIMLTESINKKLYLHYTTISLNMTIISSLRTYLIRKIEKLNYL